MLEGTEGQGQVRERASTRLAERAVDDCYPGQPSPPDVIRDASAINSLAIAPAQCSPAAPA